MMTKRERERLKVRSIKTPVSSQPGATTRQLLENQTHNASLIMCLLYQSFKEEMSVSSVSANSQHIHTWSDYSQSSTLLLNQTAAIIRVYMPVRKSDYCPVSRSYRGTIGGAVLISTGGDRNTSS